MIKGLIVTLPGSELMQLCLEHAKHHRSRVSVYSEQIVNFETAKVEAANFTGGDPVQALTSKRDEHAARADELAFIAEHIIPSESYQLDRSDLGRIGVLKDNRW